MQLFTRLCENMGPKHTQLLLDTEALCSLWGEYSPGCLNYSLKCAPFCQSTDHPMPPCLRTKNCLSKLCNLADIFSKLKVNVCLQGKHTSNVNLYDKVGGFLKEAELWRRASAEGDFTWFPQVDAFLSSEDVDIALVKLVIEGHLANLIGA